MTTSSMKFLRVRATESIGLGVAVGLIPHLLGASWITILGVVAASSAIAFGTRSGSTVLLGIFTGLAAASVLVFVLERLIGNFQIDGTVFAIVSLGLALMMIMVFSFVEGADRQTERQDFDAGVSLFIAVLVVGVLNRAARSWDVFDGFGILASNGEDNAAWLLALSHSVDKGQTVLTELSGTAGGPATGAFIATWREIMNWVHPGNATVSADNGLVLVRFYPLIATLSAIVTVVLAVVVLRGTNRWIRSTGSLVASVGSYSMVMGFATVGHFSAAVAVLFLTTAVTCSFWMAGCGRFRSAGSDVLVGLALFAAGQAWFPLTVLFAVFVALRVGSAAWMKVGATSDRRERIRFIGMTSSAAVLLIAFLRLMFPGVVGNFLDLEYITRNLTLAGGYATVNPWVSLFAIGGAIAVAAVNWGSGEESRRSSAVVAVGIPPVALFVWAYFLPPYTPQYGAIKYLYMATASLLPLAVVSVVRQGWVAKSKNGALIGVCATVGLLMFFPPPLTYASWSSTVGATRYDWVDPIVRELKASPERPVGCLNTLKDDQTQNYIAYLCSRMAFGLGGFDEIHHRVWTAANLCAAPPEQVESEWTSERQRNLTVILFDGNRTTSRAGCQTGEAPYPRGWLTPVDLRLTRTLDIRGNSVAPRG